MNYGKIAERQGAEQARHDITEFGVEWARQVANKMRRGDNTPYADGYWAIVSNT